MPAILAIMPIWMRPYAKAAVAFLGAVIGAAAIVWADKPEIAALVSFATALGVYAQPNEKVTD